MFVYTWSFMADLSNNFAGIKSPNPFWLASAPPTNMGSMVERAFDAGWGGAVWKTLGEPITMFRPGLHRSIKGALRMIGLNNIELITDRSLEVNLKEVYECKKKVSEACGNRIADGRIET
jgi:dihydropyrimidine dehydrogenase (NAD+) subunit PreA